VVVNFPEQVRTEGSTGYGPRLPITGLLIILMIRADYLGYNPRQNLNRVRMIQGKLFFDIEQGYGIQNKKRCTAKSPLEFGVFKQVCLGKQDPKILIWQQ
jgi:hypothetical protein